MVVVLVVVGEALLIGMAALFGCAALMALGYHLFMRYYEEPTLGRLFGKPYLREPSKTSATHSFPNTKSATQQPRTCLAFVSRQWLRMSSLSHPAS
jgi:hypothetical protein